METRRLGGTGLEPGAMGLGCMSLSLVDRPDEASGLRTLHATLDAGITLLDTADVYCLDHDDIGHNERLVARALRRRTPA